MAKQRRFKVSLGKGVSTDEILAEDVRVGPGGELSFTTYRPPRAGEDRWCDYVEAAFAAGVWKGFGELEPNEEGEKNG